jgi:hypothetical protein
VKSGEDEKRGTMMHVVEAQNGLLIVQIRVDQEQYLRISVVALRIIIY